MAQCHVLRALCAAAIFAAPSLPALSSGVATPTATPSAPPQIVRVVTSDRSDETLRNATRSTYVVGRDDLARHGYRTVGDALAGIPGVEITSYGPIGQNVSYGIRGSSSAQVLVLVDGVPAPGEFANSVQLGTMSTAGVRRIEVVEGGGSTLYGTGAIGGIINIITDAQNAPADATLRVGTFGDREFHVQARGFTFERIVSNNAFALPASGGNPTTRDNDDAEITSARFGVDRKVGALDATLRAGLESDRLGVAGFYPYFSPTSRENDVNANGSIGVTMERAHASSTLQLGGSRQQLAFGCDIATDSNCYSPVAALSTESRSDLSVRTTIGSATNRFLYGADVSRGTVREDSGAGVAGSVATASLAQTAAYVQETRATRWGSAYAGLRAERDGALGGEFSPSLGFITQFGANIDFKVNAATAFRAPNASELYFPNYGNPNLHPERAQVGDATLVDRHALGGVTFGWFTNRTNDLIVAQIVGTDSHKNPIYAPENVDHARMQGFTLDAATLPLHGVTAGIGLTDLYCAQNVDAGSRLPNDPVFSVSLSLDARGAQRSFFDEAGVSLRAVGARSAYDPTQPAFAQAGPYDTVDAFARLRVAPRALLTLRGYNLGNERFAQVAGYPMPGRTFALEITAK